MVILLESVRILGLGAGLFAIIVIILLGLLASLVAWTFNKGIPVLAAFMGIALVLILVFILSPKAGAVGAVLGLGMLVSILGLLISHVLTPIYAVPHSE